MAILTKTWNTANVPAAGSLESNLSIGGGVNDIQLLGIQITPSVSGGLSSYQLFRDDAFTGDIAWEVKANAMSPFYDPVKLDEDGNMSQEGPGYLTYYVDEDGTAEFHIKIANQAAVQRTYEVKIWYIVSTSISGVSVGDLMDVEDEPSAGYSDGFVLMFGASSGLWNQVDLGLVYAALSHSHGDLYYTETEIDGMILTLNEPSAGWSDGYALLYSASAGVWNEVDLAGVYAALSHSHGDLYYTETEIDNLILALDEPSAGWTDGYGLVYSASAGVWREVNLDGVFAPLSHSHGDLYYTETEIDGMILTLDEPSAGWTDGYGLVYSASAGVWREFDLTSLAAPAMGGITDVNEPSAGWTDGYVLAWSDSAGVWNEVNLGGVYSILAHAHGDIYYTETEIDNMILALNEPSAGWADGFSLIYNESAGVWSQIDLDGIYSVLAHNHNLSDLTDVDSSSAGPSDGDVLQYVASSGVWEPVAIALFGAVMDADFTAADQIMVGTGISTHGQVTLAASQLLGKKASGAATNLSAADVLTILNLGSIYYTETEIDGMILALNEPSAGWTDGYGLLYSASAGVWNEVNLGGVYSALAHTHTLTALTDVNEPSAGFSDGFVLSWSDSAGQWDETDLSLLYADLAEFDALDNRVNYIGSGMVVTGGLLTTGTNAGTFKITAGTYQMRSTDSDVAPLIPISMAEQDNQAITVAETKYFVLVTYDGDETPTVSISTTLPTDYRSIVLGFVMKTAADEVHYQNTGMRFNNGVLKLAKRNQELRGIELATGCGIAYQATNEFTMAAGVVYTGITRLTPFSAGAFDSAVAKFTYMWRDTSVWQYTADSTAINNLYYDDNTADAGHPGGDLTANQYGCHWVYLHPNMNHVYVVYGRGSYTLAEAEVAQPPADLPLILSSFAVLIGCIIIKKSASGFTLIQMVTDTYFSGAAVSDHEELGGLLGGTLAEHYHLTAAQYTVAGNTSGVNTGDQGIATLTDVEEPSAGFDDGFVLAYAESAGVWRQVDLGLVYAALVHNHNLADLTDVNEPSAGFSDGYALLWSDSAGVWNEVDLGGIYAPLSHSHGDLYYTETEIDNMILALNEPSAGWTDGYALLYGASAGVWQEVDLGGIYAALSHSHGDLYYTETEIDNLILALEEPSAGWTDGTSLIYAASAGVWREATFLTDLLYDITPELGGEMDAGAHSIGFTQQTYVGGASDGEVTIDWRLGNKAELTFDGQNETLVFTAPTNPCNLLLALIQDGVGSRTITWPATVRWPSSTAAILTTAAAGDDLVALYWNGTYYRAMSGLAFGVPA